ncbi:hypothetical protein A3D77_06115 [Candidatus Gottesmanbacteria bacterium RIFCSPHIGHO2_02_FULL_39_11]|uniref:Transport permease protein n=1 Tax=Candidatus Gottesmanbacteria bacterium RIFCSPHIGHO2_02_FULL_39_11 TaxID=1798382 RepID=A0A1F5ZWY3_9BACT|nr:MAG: hypothetical protein A3D77_06115 [Candidatus Gottesmanbacteria bacterium RIFCSPHIGHO2_02_FULL_39_11]
MININRVVGLLTQEFFITLRSLEVIIDILISPLTSLVIFGFLALFLSGTNIFIAHGLLSGVLLWQTIFIIQYSVSVGSLWNIWSRNLSNMFISPISLTEYIFTYSISGIIKAGIIFLLSSFLTLIIFHFNILSLGLLNLLLYFVNIIFFALWLGIILLGLIFRFGTRIQAFAWGVLPVFQSLSAAYYPVSILPKPLQYIANLIPVTYVFEAMRENLVDASVISWNLLITGFVLNIIYFIFAVIFFSFMFKESKRTGQFTRLEG